MAKTEEKYIRRTKDQIEEDRKTIVETITNDKNITSLTELIMVLETQKGILLSEYQVKSTLGEEKDEILKLLRIRKNVKKRGKGSDTAGTENETKTAGNFSKNKLEADDDTIWTIDASVISAPKQMTELFKFLESVPWIALTYVTLFEILKFIECTDRDDVSRGAKAFFDFYLENRNKFINIKSEEETDLSQLSNTERDDLLVKICRDKKLSLITSDRAMAVKAVFSGCEVRYLKKVASGNSIPPLKKVGEEYYFRGTSTSEVRYSILVKDTSSVYPSISKDTSSGYTPVNRGDYLYVAKKGFFAAYIIDVDWTYCLLYTIKFYNKYNLPKDLTEYTL